MKISKNELRQIIKEELNEFLDIFDPLRGQHEDVAESALSDWEDRSERMRSKVIKAYAKKAAANYIKKNRKGSSYADLLYNAKMHVLELLCAKYGPCD